MPQLTQLIGPTAGHTSCTSALPFPSLHNAEVPEAPPEPPALAGLSLEHDAPARRRRGGGERHGLERANRYD